MISDIYHFSPVQVPPSLASTFVAPPARFSSPFSSKETLKFQGMAFYSSLWAETYMRQTSSLPPSSLCWQQSDVRRLNVLHTGIHGNPVMAYGATGWARDSFPQQGFLSCWKSLLCGRLVRLQQFDVKMYFCCIRPAMFSALRAPLVSLQPVRLWLLRRARPAAGLRAAIKRAGPVQSLAWRGAPGTHELPQEQPSPAAPEPTAATARLRTRNVQRGRAGGGGTGPARAPAPPRRGAPGPPRSRSRRSRRVRAAPTMRLWVLLSLLLLQEALPHGEPPPRRVPPLCEAPRASLFPSPVSGTGAGAITGGGGGGAPIPLGRGGGKAGCSHRVQPAGRRSPPAKMWVWVLGRGVRGSPGCSCRSLSLG